MPQHLTKKQEAFAVAVAKGSNLSDAYRKAYDADKMSAAAVHVTASRLVKNSKIALRLSGLQAKRCSQSTKLQWHGLSKS